MYPALTRTTAIDRAPAAIARPQDRLPFLMVVVIVAIFLPEALGFFLFDFRFTPGRFLFFLASPVLLFSVGELILSQRYRFLPSDLLLPIAMTWMVLALAHTDGLANSIREGGATALEIGVPYFAARALLRNSEQVNSAIKLLCVCAAIAGALGVLDVLLNYHLLREGLARITGYQFYTDRPLDPVAISRLGFLRAEGPFEHPILFGIAMCYALLLSRVLAPPTKYWCWAACAAGLFFSATSEAWAAFVIGLMLVAYGRMVQMPWKWGALMTASAIGGAIFFIVMSNPFGWIFNHFTLDASTGYFRLLIWDAAGADVLDSPIFGIGTTAHWFRPLWMPNSVDSLWLRAAMLYGIPGSVLIALSLIGATTLPVRRTRRNAAVVTVRDTRLAQSLGIIIFLTLLAGFSAYYWGSLWYTVGLLAGIRATLGQIAAE